MIGLFVAMARGPGDATAHDRCPSPTVRLVASGPERCVESPPARLPSRIRMSTPASRPPFALRLERAWDEKRKAWSNCVMPMTRVETKN